MYTYFYKNEHIYAQIYNKKKFRMHTLQTVFLEIKNRKKYLFFSQRLSFYFFLV
jgi:hypothetical protein